MAEHCIDDTTTSGYPTVTLSCGGTGVDATVAPSLGMIVCSLRQRGAELLAQRGGLGKYAASGSTMGIPLLHPWANRLSQLSYSVGGRSVSLDPHAPRLHRDGQGLPMHGLLGAYPGWQITERSADARGARLRGEIDFAADAELLALFPFPHTLELEIALRDASLTLTTTLRPSADVAVPISFGFHPYLQLPGVERATWHIEAPVGRRLRLDRRMIPTGEREAIFIEPGPLDDRSFDDLFTDLADPATFVVGGGGRRIALTFESGYRFAQIYAPQDDAFICFEPMTAPINALISGDALQFVAPGATYRAAFAIAIA
jgi:aldose 1-epimerase